MAIYRSPTAMPVAGEKSLKHIAGEGWKKGCTHSDAGCFSSPARTHTHTDEAVRSLQRSLLNRRKVTVGNSSRKEGTKVVLARNRRWCGALGLLPIKLKNNEKYRNPAKGFITRSIHAKWTNCSKPPSL
ncbi:hypothetical protein LXL04_015730 [Taraxacum kok-saghyz]